MEQRTCNIIMCCKGNGHRFYGDNNDIKKSIAYYMGKECDYPMDKYSDSMLYDIVKEAFLDFLKTCDNPSLIVRDYMDTANKVFLPTDFDRIRSVLCLVQVRNDNGYVNGFTQKMIEQSDIDIN